jgi:hypothetical protein
VCYTLHCLVRVAKPGEPVGLLPRLEQRTHLGALPLVVFQPLVLGVLERRWRLLRHLILLVPRDIWAGAELVRLRTVHRWRERRRETGRS